MCENTFKFEICGMCRLLSIIDFALLTGNNMF